MFGEEDLIEKSVFTEYYDRKARLKESILPKNFDVVPDQYSFLKSIYCEVVKGKGFDGESLFVDYVIDIPTKDWSLKEHHSTFLRGNSQIAHAAPCTGSPELEAYFGYPIELATYRRSGANPESIPDPISICFKVSSVNFWDRNMVEGYGFCHVPSEPGSYEMDIEMWKPCGDNMSRIRSFFLGGSPEIQDMTYLIQKPSSSGKAVNKYGFHTQTTGRLTVRFHVVIQKQVTSHLYPALEATSTGPNARVKSISEALMRAKARLDAFRAKEIPLQP